MASPEDLSVPFRQLPLRAGGGRSSSLIELETVNDFTPIVLGHLKKIYSSLTAYSNDTSPDPNNPSLSSYEDFLRWFQTSAASALAPPPKHDLSYPISNYYISSSHNTYLSGNQLYGSASGDAYKNVLVRGCRCLEIDVWDGEGEDSSASSSDTEQQDHKHESTRDRANSVLTRFSHHMDKVIRKHAPTGTSGFPSLQRHLSGSGQSPGPIQPQTQSPGVLTRTDTHRLRAEPRVYHGYTLTKDIPFRTVCRAINASAFEATDLPLIISLEVHCGKEQQEMMVEILRHEFKDHLVDGSNQNELSGNALPSPDKLRNKILIKVKATPQSGSEEIGETLESQHSEEQEVAVNPNIPPEKAKPSKTVKALSDLGIYTRAYSFKNFGQPEARIPTHVFSLSEAKVEDIHSHPLHGPALFAHNRNFLMRVFPSGLRVDSSNVEPCFLWRQGAQMVALNWQKLDRGTMLNEGMFAGEEGWVLKPEGFRGTCSNHNDGAKPIPDPQRHLLDLEIELMAAQNLPIPPGKDASHLTRMKPYVQLQLHVDTHGPPGQELEHSDSRASLYSKYTPHLHHRSADDADDEEARKLKRQSKISKTSDPDFGCELVEWKGIHDVVDQLSFLRCHNAIVLQCLLLVNKHSQQFPDRRLMGQNMSVRITLCAHVHDNPYYQGFAWSHHKYLARGTVTQNLYNEMHACTSWRSPPPRHQPV